MELKDISTTARQTGRDNLIIYVRPRSGTCVVKLIGELDLASAEGFEREVNELLESDIQSVVVDLAGLEFIDSTGVGSMLKLTRLSQADSDKLRFTQPQGQVAQVLDLTGMSKIVPFA